MTYYYDNVVGADVLDFENDVFILEQTQYDSTTYLGCYFEESASMFKCAMLPEIAGHAFSLAELSSSDNQMYLDFLTAPDANESGFFNEKYTDSRRKLLPNNV
jgi:hypothetical protein